MHEKILNAYEEYFYANLAINNEDETGCAKFLSDVAPDLEEILSMKQTWSMQNEIQKRVQQEADREWSKTETPPLPKFISTPKVKLSSTVKYVMKQFII